MARPAQSTRYIVALGILLISALAGCTQDQESVPVTAEAPALAQATRTPLPLPAEETPTYPQQVTQSALQAIRERGELRAGVLYNDPPFTSLADNGDLQGYEIDILRRIAELWNIDVTFVQVTRQTRIPMLESGEVDLLAGSIPHRRDLGAYLEFSDPIFRSGYGLLVRADSAIDGLEDLAARPVGFISDEANALLSEQAAVLGIGLDARPYTSLDEAELALAGDGDASIPPIIDALVARRETLMLLASAHRDLELLAAPLSPASSAFAFRRGDTPLRDALNLGLQQVAAEGKLSDAFQYNLYGYPADIFPIYPGQVKYTFETLPADITGRESALARIRRGEPLRIAGLDLSQEPALFDSQPIIDGYNRAVINEMARRWGSPVTELPDSTGQKAYEMLVSGQADVAVGLTRELTYLGDVAFSEPYYQIGLRVIHQNEVALFGIGDLEFKPSMAAPPLDISESLIRDNNVFPSIKTAETFEEAYRQLSLFTVWAVVGDEYALYLMGQADENLELIGQRYRPRNRVMAVPSTDADLLALVNYTLQDMALDGTIDRLRDQYFRPYVPEDEELAPLDSMQIWPGISTYLGVGGY